ncbi:DUF5103 domain-containing protein [Bizionia gelidisalsuginis]|uniref:DUF5103 domain-containing protein n=1 Tax=Bizionia gelidisalsuginis TaxID=291188 RepID=A0ABY3MA79_9FLAO|nr:DUF5103 domain-containing protein [Bizionia gelidisalsuginis]TYC12655.1 DUF5103 domain-containing protein [Bizionia gelidisalsuginis]
MSLSYKLLLLTFFTLATVCSQVEEIAPQDYIKTISFSKAPESALPIFRLGETITLEFDVLNGNEDDFYYEIKHYNKDWTPSVLIESEYLEGFNEQRIRDYRNSFNTYQIFSHYTLTIPNEQTRGLKKSGNYSLIIYNDYNEIEFTRKFMVYEDVVNVGVDIKRSRDVSAIKEKQTVDIVVNANNFIFNNPKQSVKAVIIQNSNLKTAITNLKPQYILGEQLSYRYTKESSFYGGNEYLYFENKNLRGANNGVQFIKLKELYNTYLYRNIPRFDAPYTYNPDINGNFLITALDTDTPKTNADYAQVHFSLQLEQLPNNKTVHVYGYFNNYVVDETNQMTYYNDTGSYELPLRLKQGFYNYKYVVKDNNGTIDENAISGNFYQTENDYKVLIYYRDLGARYDRIIGVGEGNSVNITN